MIKVLKKLLKYLNKREEKKKRLAYVQANLTRYMPLQSYKNINYQQKKLDKVNKMFLKRLERLSI